jgi:hypothetical protein
LLRISAARGRPVELTRRVERYLRRARLDPGLPFEEEKATADGLPQPARQGSG